MYPLSYGAHIAGLSADTVYTVTVHDPSGVITTTWSITFRLSSISFLPSFLSFFISLLRPIILPPFRSFRSFRPLSLYCLPSFFPFFSFL
jgi:hypothetical protein